MTKARTYPNVLWIGFRLLICLFLVWIGFNLVLEGLGIRIPILLPPLQNPEASEARIDMYVVAFGFLFVLMALYILRNISFRWCTVIVNNDGLTLSKPLLWRKKKVPWNEIEHFSTSQICTYNTWGGSILWSSDSIVIYLKGGEVYEIIKAYSFRFDIVKKILTQYEVSYLGFEPHNQSFLGVRQYKFLKKND